jgi:hypothetical protein
MGDLVKVMAIAPSKLANRMIIPLENQGAAHTAVSVSYDVCLFADVRCLLFLS